MEKLTPNALLLDFPVPHNRDGNTNIEVADDALDGAANLVAKAFFENPEYSVDMDEFDIFIWAFKSGFRNREKLILDLTKKI